MSRRAWRKVNDSVLEALELEGDERDAYLRDLEREDPDLAAEVRSLVEVETGSLSRFDRPLVDLYASRSTFETGQRIGPHRVIREIGRGGTGVVYLAERDDGELERRVAIKVLQRGMDSEDLVRRFRIERQILADLAHPNIAELYEGGTTAEGQPYFVMEPVDGQPIDEFCDRRRLGIRERLELFVVVCSAVDRAHRSLVVHRDLKPSNILVTEEGEPKLLDFGIAKLLDPETAQARTRTLTGPRLMTPEYASPEQVLGAPLTTATDVYSLGVLLYELLTGRRPHSLERRDLDEARRVICETEAIRPSAAVDRSRGEDSAALARGETPERLRRRLAGDLDRIVGMALRKEPDRRYGSARELAEDVTRHLRGLPVRARPDTVSYRLGKLLRRRKREAAAVALALALVGAWGFERLEQRERLERAHDRTRRVSEFLVELFEVADPSEARGNEVTAREILDRGVERIDEELEEEPEARAALMLTMGRVYRNLGLYDEAEDLAETAVELSVEVHGEESVETARALGLRATLRFDQGDPGGAETLFRRAHEIQRQRLGAHDPATIASLSDVAVMLERQGDYAAAEPILREVLALRRKRFGDESAEVAGTLGNLGVLLQNREDLEGAEAVFRESLEIKRRLLGADHPGVALALNNLALLLLERDDPAAAEPLFLETLEIARRVFGEEHPNVAKTLGNLAGVYAHTGDLERAEDLYRHSLEMRVRLLGEEHRSVARARLYLARVRADRGAPEDAARLARRALVALPAEDLAIRPTAEGLLGEALVELGRPHEAEPLLESAYQALRATRGEGSDAARSAAERLVRAYEATGDGEQAEAIRLLLEESTGKNLDEK